VAEHHGRSSDELKVIVDGIASAGSTPLVVAETKASFNGQKVQARVLGVMNSRTL